jgi:hypothetical protein
MSISTRLVRRQGEAPTGAAQGKETLYGRALVVNFDAARACGQTRAQ